MIDTLYILSAGRSGSTLLNLLLGSHPDAVAVSELTQLPRDIAHGDRCSCGRKIAACEFWGSVADRLAASLGIDVWRDPYALQLGFIADPRRRNSPPLTAGYARAWKLRHGIVYLAELGVPVPGLMRRRFDHGVNNTLQLHEIIRQASGRRIVVDASKSYLKGIALYRRCPERTRLILLSRDGRASFYSRLRDGYGRTQSLKAWRNYYRHALPLLERRVPPQHIVRVKYEDLAADPGAHIRRICEFAELPYVPSMLDIGSTVHHVTSGNDMRLNADTRIRPDTAWQTELQPADNRFFEACAGTLNRLLGYE